MTAFTNQSAMPFIQQNQPFQSVAVGAQNTCTIPVGQTYLGHILQCTVAGAAATQAQIKAGVDIISLKLNGTEIWHVTGTQMVYLNNYYRGTKLPTASPSGMLGATGLLFLFFERPWMQKLAAQRGPALGTVGQNSYQLQVTLDAESAVDGLQLWNWIDVVAQPLGRHLEIRSQSHNFASTGLDKIIDLPQADTKNPCDTIQAIHLFVTTANISNLIIKAEKLDIWNAPPAILQQLYQFATDSRTIDTGVLTLDFMSRNRQDGEFPDSALTLEVDPTWTSAPGTYQILMEILSGAPGTTTQGTAPAVATVPGGSPARFNRRTAGSPST